MPESELTQGQIFVLIFVFKNFDFHNRRNSWHITGTDPSNHRASLTSFSGSSPALGARRNFPCAVSSFGQEGSLTLV